MNGNLQCAQLLVQHGAQVNITDVAGKYVTYYLYTIDNDCGVQTGQSLSLFWC